MATSLNIWEKVEIVRLYSICDGNAAQTRRMLYRKGLNEGKWKKIGVNRANIPCIQTVLDINKTLELTEQIFHVSRQYWTLTKHSMRPVVLIKTLKKEDIRDQPEPLKISKE